MGSTSQQVIGPLRGVSYEVVKEMGLGEALLWAVWVNDPRYRGRVVHGYLRPSCVRAGGETKSFR